MPACGVRNRRVGCPVATGSARTPGHVFERVLKFSEGARSSPGRFARARRKKAAVTSYQPVWQHDSTLRTAGPSNSRLGDASLFLAWVAVSAYAAMFGYVLLPTAGLAVVGVIPAAAAIAGLFVCSRARRYTRWGLLLTPVAVITGLAFGAHHFVQGSSCSSMGSASADSAQAPVTTSCVPNHAPQVSAHVWPYVAACVAALLITVFLTVIGGRHARRARSR